ncbi:hypothetical protein VB711_18270 [Cronbergia sp. UHCC 0137]|uniref:hypothetical protein n=1 Tax=Cronbergia sp. UHCC 0137 TaxID=3110239 RepID=UPI002B1FF25E|nr:hypothetical protein [Cronbergia sp. UHCC 0137]MEA5619772.1 hypothetical protein [Cronbergia sp. UHCC 0137]
MQSTNNRFPQNANVNTFEVNSQAVLDQPQITHQSINIIWLKEVDGSLLAEWM